jgi:hypothetical protein
MPASHRASQSNLWVNTKNNFSVILRNIRCLFEHDEPFQRNRVYTPVPSGYLTLPTVTALSGVCGNSASITCEEREGYYEIIPRTSLMYYVPTTSSNAKWD